MSPRLQRTTKAGTKGPASATPAAMTWRDAQAGARALGPTGNPATFLAGALMLADTATILLASAGAYLLRHGLVSIPFEIASTTLLAVLLTLNAMQVSGAYRWSAATPLELRIGAAFRGWSVVFVVLLSLAYFTKMSDDFSRAWAIGWYVLALLGFALARAIVAARVWHWARRGKLASTVAIVDLGGNGEALARHLQKSSGGQVRLVGVFSPAGEATRRNSIADLIALSRLFRIDDVIVTVSGRQSAEADAVIRKLGTIPTNVHLCPEFAPVAFAPRAVGLLYGQPVLTVYQRPFVGWGRVAKRAEDIVIASLALVFVAPLLAVLAVLIKLDSPGPVLFRQRRLGFNNNVIIVLKLRTMADHKTPDSNVTQAGRNDPRVTRIGWFLRRSSLDELPQLLNVLRGEMSLVGPRPHALAHNEQYAALVDDYLGRHRVRPGITGWAQVNGLRGETDTLEKMQRRVEHDLAYIDGWSLVLDAKILAMTVVRGAFGSTAY